jgi:hypothetical protein
MGILGPELGFRVESIGLTQSYKEFRGKGLGLKL